ncbi:MAG TPA: NAD(P)-dependent oxidoreductase [Pyrinomonadaceae bacterium]|nr:NAD(P)-dependent oxidoreductase [Pyrinomonadaceae bacterium]
MKVLVTGGSGYLGIHVKRFFEADDFSRRSNRNILESADLDSIADYDVVIHLAAHLDKDPAAAELCFRTNVQGTENVLQRMRPDSVFIYASTKDVYGAHAGKYGEVPEICATDYIGQTALEWSKLIAERYVEYYAHQRQIRACIFRLSTVYARPSDGNEYGFVTHYVESVKRGWPIHLPAGGSAVRDILHVNDFSRACRAFIESSRKFGLYNLGGGKNNASTLTEIVDAVSKVIQRDPVIVLNDSMPNPVPLNYVTDLTRINEELEWEPRVGIERGLRSLI